MSQPNESFFKRHPVVSLLAFNAILFGGMLLIAEIGLRMAITYQPGYYVSVSGTNQELEYPYGIIKINSEGFPDAEFDLTKDRRIGYYGDSVTYGVGAGYGYRVSDILEKRYPEWSHLNFGGIGLSVGDGDIEFCVGLAKKFGLTDMVYLVNLNDILPDEVASGEVTTVVGDVRSKVLDRADWLRGRSYLYTWFRNTVRDFLASRGTGFHGYPTYELFPSKHEKVIAETAGRINRLGDALEAQGTKLILVYLPYEMQISEEAAQTYAEAGIQWDPEFIQGATQRLLSRHLAPSIPRHDALAAFVDPTNPESSRQANGLGEYFVYNRGDKLDWNHPTREGHQKIADMMIEQDVLGAPRGGAAN